jgi:Flp pilus assembly protein TadG
VSATPAARPAAWSRFAARLLGERGAAAVEFALVLPLLLLIFLGIVQFSQAFQVQAQLAAAAREGARVMALSTDSARAQEAVQGAADSLHLTAAQIDVDPGTCASEADATGTVTVTVRYPIPLAWGLINHGPELTGKAVMRCGG